MSDERRRPGNGARGGDRDRAEAHGVIKSELPLPLSPEPTAPEAKRPVDDSATVPVQLMEVEGDIVTVTRDTPPPLPPSPASAAAEVWLEDAETRPSALTDIAPSLPGSLSSSGSISSGAHRMDLDPIAALREAHAQAARAARKLLVLSTVTAFAVGLAVGVLLLRSC